MNGQSTNDRMTLKVTSGMEVSDDDGTVALVKNAPPMSDLIEALRIYK